MKNFFKMDVKSITKRFYVTAVRESLLSENFNNNKPSPFLIKHFTRKVQIGIRRFHFLFHCSDLQILYFYCVGKYSLTLRENKITVCLKKWLNIILKKNALKKMTYECKIYFEKNDLKIITFWCSSKIFTLHTKYFWEDNL